jgi:hypothetical protein
VFEVSSKGGLAERARSRRGGKVNHRCKDNVAMGVRLSTRNKLTDNPGSFKDKVRTIEGSKLIEGLVAVLSSVRQSGEVDDIALKLMALEAIPRSPRQLGRTLKSDDILIDRK